MKNYDEFLKAKELIKNRKYKEAEVILKKLYRLEPENNVLKFELAKILIKNKKTLNEGKELLEELLNTSSKTYAMLELGKLEASGCNKEKARIYFEELLNTNNNTYAMFELGKLELREGNKEKARMYFEELLNLKKDKYAMLELGKLEVSEENNKKARNYFEELLNLKKDKYAMLELGKLELREGNNKKARNYFEELLNTNSKTYAMLELGRLEVSEGNKEKARMYFEELLNTNSKTYAMLELGRLEVSEENNKKARMYFEELINTNSKTYAMLELGKLELREGNNKKARNYFEELLNLKKDKYAMLELIFLEINECNYEDAYKLFVQLPKNEITKKQYEHMKFYLEYKLGKISDDDNQTKGYFCNQLINYDENETINHIKLHLDENDQKNVHTVYVKGLNIEILYNDIKIKIKNINPNIFNLVDKYIIDYDYIIASINGVDTNKIKVVTFSNTKDIITMYPIINELEQDNIIIYSGEKPKVKTIKRESQIDKFNKKYGIK